MDEFLFYQRVGCPNHIDKDIREISSLQIETNRGALTIQGIPNGIPVSVYDVIGAQVGYAVSIDGKAVVYTNLQKGDIAIVKVEDNTAKVVVK